MLEHEDGLMTMNAAAKYMSVSRRTVERWIKNGIIPGSIVKKIGKAVRIQRSDLDAWLGTTNKEVKNDG